MGFRTKNLPWNSAIPWAILLGGFTFYSLCAAPGLAILDSGEFLGVATTLGVAHPTGYPLYALLGQLATLFPAGNEAYLINLTSAAAAAATAFFMALAAGEFGRLAGLGNGPRALAMAFAGLVTLLGRTLWAVGTLAEVYALNSALWAALLWTALRLRRVGGAREMLTCSLVAGFSFTNHMTLVLFLPAAAAVAWPGRRKARALAPLLPLAAAIVLLGASLNLYLPLRAFRKPLFNWNDPSTLRAFVIHMAALQYQTNFWKEGLAGVAATGRGFRGALLANVTPAAILALVALARSFGKGFRLQAAALLLYFGAYLAYCSVYTIHDISYYFIPLYLIVTFFAAGGVGLATAKIGELRDRVRRPLGVAATVALLAAIAWAAVANFPFGNRHGFIFAELYGSRLLRALPARAVFFPSGDTNGFVTWYEVYARRRRPDVALLAQVRFLGRGYLTAVRELYPDLILPKEKEVKLLAARALVRGDFTPEEITVGLTDDFILPGIIAAIIADNAGRRPMFWGLGDPAENLRGYIAPYDLSMQIINEPLPRGELATRAAASVAALSNLMSCVASRDTGELRDPLFHELAGVYYRTLGIHLLQWRLYLPQIQLFQSYISLFPNDVNGYQNLAIIYVLTGRPAAALAYYRRALELAPENGEIRRRLILVLTNQGKTDEALKLAEGFVGATPGEADYIQGFVLMKEGRAEKALVHFEAAAPYFPDDANFWRDKGFAHETTGDVDAAVAAFSKALAIRPDYGLVYTARGVAYLKDGNRKAAAADFKAALKYTPTDAQAHYNLACIYATEGQIDIAFEHLQAALKYNAARYGSLASTDPDLANCRRSPRFAHLVAPYTK